MSPQPNTIVAFADRVATIAETSSSGRLRRSRRGSQSAIALVIVLGFLTLITVLVVAFFSSVTTNAQSSHLYVRNVQTQQLAESAVSIAMSQIKDATTQGTGVTWISQPGMIRTFNSSGSTVNSYRLYSSSTMKLGGSVDPESEVGVVQRKEWASYPAHMVDLNRPARDASNNLVYPIFDPRAADQPEKIEGFEFDASAMGDKFITTSSPAPMPVRWLYILAKGDIVNGSELDKTKATFAAANKDNPVVGRIAFWTDDESCKVNINTAAGDEWNAPDTTAGSYWDMPHTNTTFDRQALANYQPTQGEYQRYPGHPATTYLSAVFPTLTREQIGSIASRIDKGGSLGGTVLANSRILGDANRLYASVDELIFDPERKDQVVTKERLERGRFFLTANSRAPETNLFNLPRIATWPIHHTDTTQRRTAFDRLIAFCSTIGPAANGQTYFFDRNNADSPSADFTGRNVTLYKYLQSLTDRDIPGYGGKISAKYGAADRDQILTEILDYIRSTNLYDDNLAAGQQFTDLRTGQTSVNSGHGQVTPLHITAPGTNTDTMGFGRFYTISEAALQFICTADPTVADSNIAVVPPGTPANQVAEAQKKINRTLNGTALTAGQRRIETMLLLELFSPSQGWTGLAPNMSIRIRGLDKLAVNGTSLGFPADATMVMTNNGTSTYHGRAWGGNSGFRFVLTNRRMPARPGMAADSGFSTTTNYPFIGIPITVTLPATGSQVMAFTSGSSSDALTVETYAGATVNSDTLVQSMKVKFPNGSFPIPNLVTAGTPEMLDSVPKKVADATTEKSWWTFARDGALPSTPGRVYYVNQSPGNNRPAEAAPNGARCGAFIRQEDVVRSVLPNHGDYRLIAGRRNVPQAQFAAHPYYTDTTRKLAHSLLEPVGYDVVQGADFRGALVENASYGTNQRPDVIDWATMQARDPNSQTRLKRGDFDTGMTTLMDGAYINKPDEGNNYRGTGAQIPYFDNNQAQEAGGETFFSPNRQIPSAVMFGSLPTGLMADSGAGRSWRTLLFRPDASATATGVGQHDGSKSPKDYLLLDLFWMPVVEPYAISEPFSTAGKVNLNCQVAPFTYIKRTTALRALLKSERVTAIPAADAGKYKGSAPASYRNVIDADETLKQFTTRFSTNKPFRSAGEICELYLVPKGKTVEEMPVFWNSTNKLTGDNLRERPYATLYPRLTTKSNIYSVHFCVQTLRQVNRNTSGNWNTWDENRDAVTGEYRGTTLIERYIDLQDNLPDFADSNLDPDETLDKHCKLRVLMTRKFAP